MNIASITKDGRTRKSYFLFDDDLLAMSEVHREWQEKKTFCYCQHVTVLMRRFRDSQFGP
jgi:hypothetical protein